MVEWLNVGVGMLNALLTALIAIAVYQAGRKVARLEQDRAIKDAWISVDQAALATPEQLRVLDALLHPGEARDEAASRKRWLIYMILNPIDAAWSAAKSGHMPEGALDSSEASMRALVQDGDAYRMIQSYVYNLDFRKRCAELREEFEGKAPAQRSHGEPAFEANHVAGDVARVA